ncbi:MAG: right-handed parallel beta-helix repeat-containing protein [Myxococcota bacterium]
MWIALESLALAARTLEVGPSGGYTSIGAAMYDARAGDTVRVAPGVYREVVWIEQAITLESTGGAAETVIAFPGGYGWSAPVVYVLGAQGAVIRGFTLDGTGTGSAISVEYSALELSDAVLFGAEDENLHVFAADLVVRDSALRGSATAHPRQIGVYDGSLELERVTVSKGFDRFDGGGLFSIASDLTIRDCRFSDNEARLGGAIDALTTADNVVTVEDTTFERNDAAWYAGALRVEGQATTLVRRSTFVDNHSADGMGGIDVYGATHFELADSQFVGNVGELWVGTVLLYDVADALIVRNRFVDNHAGEAGGAIGIDGATAAATIAGNLFCGNTAVESGGALAFSGNGVLSAVVVNNLFVANDAPTGGALRTWSSSVQVDQNTVVGGSTGDAALWFTDSIGSAVNDVFVDLGSPPLGADLYSDLTLAWSLSWDVGGASIGIPAEPSLVDADPGFSSYVAGDCGSDLHPAPGSTLVDGGDPTRRDADGTPSDLGAYGGEDAPLWLDVDGDGRIEGDCAPSDPRAGAGGEDVPADGVDPDCDGIEACWSDADGDGVGSDALGAGPLGCASDGWAPATGDCDDRDPKRAGDCTDRGRLPSAWFCGTTPAAGPALTPWLVAAAGVRRRRVYPR